MGMMDGKVAAVTGGARGVGRAIALGLARAGAAVVVNDLGVSLAGGHAKLETTSLYTRVATNTIQTVMSPLDRLAPLRSGRDGPPA